MTIQQLVNKAARLQFVELLQAQAEHPGRKLLNFGLVELVFRDDLFDELTLLFGAIPRAGLVTVHAVAVRRHKAGLLDLLIHYFLKRFIETRTFLTHVVEVRELSFDRDTELMLAVSGQTQTLRIIGNEFNCHCVFPFFVIVDEKKEPSRWGWALSDRGFLR